MARILLNNAGPPLTIPSTSNHSFICQGAFNRARIMLDIVNIPLTIPSTRNHHFNVYCAIIILAIAASLLLLDPFGIISFMGILGVAVLLLTIPSTRHHPFLVYGANIMLVIAGP